MGNPKSFKDLHKNIAKPPMYGKLIATHNKPIFIPDPKVIEAQEKIRKELERYVNTQRCIVCGAQLDGPVYVKEARLYCIENNDHYECDYVPGKRLPIRSKAVYNFEHYGYELISFHKNENNYYNSIYKLDLDLIPKFRQKEKVRIFYYEGIYLRLPKALTEKEFMQKIKVYMTFS